AAPPYTLAFPCVTAYPALWLATRRPALVERLVLMQAPDWPRELAWKQRRDPKNILGTPGLGQLALKLLKRRRVDAWYRAALGRRELLQPFTAATQQAFDHGACFCLASAFQRLLAGDEPDFGSIAQPALVFWGTADRSHAGTDRASILRYLPQAQLIEWQDGIGHFPELEAPQRFAAALRQAGW
ncbi:MAG: alpha/beta fold hydrolase, partial [Solimonas sp.]